MSTVAIIGFFKNRAEVKARADGAAVDTTHFLGQRNFGYVVIYLNIMASFASGFLMVFVPDVGAQAGLACMCWLLVCNSFTFTSIFIWPLLARLTNGRNYLGPNDFTADRFQSFTVRFLTSFGGGFSSYMILTIEWMILKLIASWLFGGTGATATWLLAIFIFSCETLGGMNSVPLAPFAPRVVIPAARWPSSCPSRLMTDGPHDLCTVLSMLLHAGGHHRCHSVSADDARLLDGAFDDQVEVLWIL
eukprot:COSAG01_NODE_1359_length_10584_cov_133.767668_9_plen_247_part_00